MRSKKIEEEEQEQEVKETEQAQEEEVLEQEEQEERCMHACMYVCVLSVCLPFLHDNEYFQGVPMGRALILHRMWNVAPWAELNIFILLATEI